MLQNGGGGGGSVPEFLRKAIATCDLTGETGFTNIRHVLDHIGFLYFSDLKWINPQYHIHLKDPDSADHENKCTVIISLMEKGYKAATQIAIGYDIYKVTLIKKK